MGTSPFEEGQVFANRPCGPVMALALVEQGGTFDLANLPNPFAVGRTARDDERPRADVQLSSAQVSLIHAEIERRGDRLWCHDKGSTNGTFIHNEREPEPFPIRRGLVFRVADVPLIALDQLQLELRTRLAWTIGLDQHARIHHAIAKIADDQPLLIVGPRGHEAEKLARTIHDTSGRRDYPFRSFTKTLRRGDDALLREAKWGTIYIDLREVGDVMKSFAEIVLGRREASLQLRPIISVPSIAKCHKLLGQMAAEAAIDLPTMVQRRSEIPRLIDMLMAEAGASCTTAALGPVRFASLQSEAVAKNLTLGALHGVARRLRAFIEHDGNESAAAEALGMSRQNLNAWLHRLFDE